MKAIKLEKIKTRERMKIRKRENRNERERERERNPSQVPKGRNKARRRGWKAAATVAEVAVSGSFDSGGRAGVNPFLSEIPRFEGLVPTPKPPRGDAPFPYSATTLPLM